MGGLRYKPKIRWMSQEMCSPKPRDAFGCQEPQTRGPPTAGRHLKKQLQTARHV